MRRIVFCHGKESGPRGFKIRELSAIAGERGWQAESIDFTAEPDPDARVALLLRRMAGTGTDETILAGSSMGGYVAALASSRIRPAALFLMAPVFGLPGYRVRRPQIDVERCVIVHGWRDDVVPAENVFRFAARHRAEMHLLDAGHDLHDAIADVKFLFGKLLADVSP